MSIRVLWCSDAADASSGYSQVTRQQAPALAALGHDVALLATYGHHGAVRSWTSTIPDTSGAPITLRVYPGGNDPFANDVIGQAARDWQADIVITLKDSFVFRPDAFQGLRWCGLVPVDHDPMPPQAVGACRAMYRPIAYAPHGFRALRAAGFDPLYAPHSFDPRVFSPQDRHAARQFLGIPDDLFIVGTVAVNRGGLPSRKAWTENLQAFARFAAGKPNARYFLHTNICDDGFEGGIPLRAEAAEYSILDKVLFCDQEKYKAGFPDGYLNAFYNAIDVLNAVSLGEGFGIPALEAQAAGTPVIVGDWCAHEDLCFAGWKVAKGEAYRYKDGQRAYVYMPSPLAIADRMEQAYQALTVTSENYADGSGGRRAELRAQAITGAAGYELGSVVNRYWKPVLEELEAQIRGEGSRGVLRIVRPEEVLAI